MSNYTLPIKTMVNLVKNSEQFNTIVRIKSKETNKDYRFKLIRKFHNGAYYTHVYEDVGYLRFTYLGWFNGKNIILKGEMIQDTISAKAICWCLKNLYVSPETLERKTLWYHMGICIKCSRKLINRQSIDLGVCSTCCVN